MNKNNSTLGPASQHVGKGPKNYRRSDARIHEDVCDRLLADGSVDASQIEVLVKDGCVYLEGTVPDPHMKKFAEDVAHEIVGVTGVENRITLRASDETRETYLPGDLQ